MITFLSSPKAFTGHTDKIQRRAIKSWLALHPFVEIFIYGTGEGVKKACREIGAHHIPDISCAPSGIPYFNAIVEHSSIYAKNDIQCYLNCDILMTKNVTKAVQTINFPRYLVVGQRIDLGEKIECDPTNSNWKTEILKYAKRGKVRLHEPTGMDYFIFPRGMWKNLPPLVIGRGGYDGALTVFCLRNKIPLINATFAFPALHQFHDYGHVYGGKKTVINGEDAQNNIRLHKIKHSIPDSADAQWLIFNNTVIPNFIQKDFIRNIELALRFQLKCEILSLIVRLLWRTAVATGIHRKRAVTIQNTLFPYSTLRDTSKKPINPLVII